MEHMQALSVLLIASVVLQLYTSPRFSMAEDVAKISVFDIHNLGRMVYARGKIINASFADAILQVGSLCACRAACYSFIGCLALSYFPNGDSGECRLAKNGPLVTTYTDDENAVSLYKIGTLGGHRSWHYEHVYWVPDMQLDFLAAKAYCLSIPSFQLAVMTTADQNWVLGFISRHTGLKYYVDLEKTNATQQNGAPMWGDQTPFGGNNIAWNVSISVTSDFGKSAFIFESGILKELAPDKAMSFLCQAKKLNATIGL